MFGEKITDVWPSGYMALCSISQFQLMSRGGWQTPGLRAAQNLQMPHPRDRQGWQISHSSPGGGGGSWVQQELTDALPKILNTLVGLR